VVHAIDCVLCRRAQAARIVATATYGYAERRDITKEQRCTSLMHSPAVIREKPTALHQNKPRGW
jgi:hypothetical protein